MSFQHFRVAASLPPHLNATIPNNQTFATNHVPVDLTPSKKRPYGAGDSDDGYTLCFANLEEFDKWREEEEIQKSVEFVKGDTHGSKADPPRFKDHTKLVCARHSRSGRKKYVKKYPERVRKVPSRKIEGDGCNASISYKTYFDTEEVRVCYVDQHSHEIGLANLPFTRRGRKATVEQEKEKSRSNRKKAGAEGGEGGSQDGGGPVASGSGGNPEQFTNTISMIAPLPPQHASFQPQPQPPPPAVQSASVPHYPQFHHAPPPPPQPIAPTASADRWDNMSTLFESIRVHARSYDYPAPSVAALEAVLIRLYLESPVTSQAIVMHNPNIQPNLGEAASG